MVSGRDVKKEGAQIATTEHISANIPVQGRYHI